MTGYWLFWELLNKLDDDWLEKILFEPNTLDDFGLNIWEPLNRSFPGLTALSSIRSY